MSQPDTTIEITLPCSVIYTLAMAAHVRDVTLNEFVVGILMEATANVIVDADVCLWCKTEAPLTRGYCSTQCEHVSHNSF